MSEFVRMEYVPVEKIIFDPLYDRLIHNSRVRSDMARKIPVSVVENEQGDEFTLIHGYPFTEFQERVVQCNIYDACTYEKQLELASLLWNRFELKLEDKIDLIQRLHENRASIEVMSRFTGWSQQTVKKYLAAIQGIDASLLEERKIHGIKFSQWVRMQRLAKRLTYISVPLQAKDIQWMSPLSLDRLSELIKITDTTKFSSLDAPAQETQIEEIREILGMQSWKTKLIAKKAEFGVLGITKLLQQLNDYLSKVEDVFWRIEPSEVPISAAQDISNRLEEMYRHLRNEWNGKSE